MKYILIALAILIILLSCSKDGHINQKSNETREIKSTVSKYADGTHSSLVEYYDPKTMYEATCDLDVEVKNGKIVKIYF